MENKTDWSHLDKLLYQKYNLEQSDRGRIFPKICHHSPSKGYPLHHPVEGPERYRREFCLRAYEDQKAPGIYIGSMDSRADILRDHPEIRFFASVGYELDEKDFEMIHDIQGWSRVPCITAAVVITKQAWKEEAAQGLQSVAAPAGSSRCSPPVHRKPACSRQEQHRGIGSSGWRGRSRGYRGATTAWRERSAAPSSGRFRRRHAGRAGTCWTRFAGRPRNLRWTSPSRHLVDTFPDCREITNLRQSPYEPLAYKQCHCIGGHSCLNYY